MQIHFKHSECIGNVILFCKILDICVQESSLVWSVDAFWGAFFSRQASPSSSAGSCWNVSISERSSYCFVAITGKQYLWIIQQLKLNWSTYPNNAQWKKRNDNAPHHISYTMLFFKVGELEKLAQVSGCLNHTRLIILMNAWIRMLLFSLCSRMLFADNFFFRCLKTTLHGHFLFQKGSSLVKIWVE